MSILTASVSNFDLTSTWKIVLDKSGWVMSPTPNTGSADKTFDFTGIPAGSIINSATLTATMNSPTTGAALRTVDGGSFSGSKSVSITPGGYNTFRFRFKANGTTSAPYGDRSSTLSFSDVTITVDYTPPGGGGGGTPPQGPYIGNLAVSPADITAGGSLYIATGACDGNLIRHISIYRADTNAFVATVVASYGIEAGAWMFPIPVEWCEFAPNDTQFQLRIELYAHYPDGGWGGVENRTVTVYAPEDIKPTIGSLTTAYNANGVNGAITKYVQNYSKTNLAMGSVSGVYGSSIISYEITGGGLSALSSSATLGPFSQTGSITFTAKVVDSRGRVGTNTVAINVEPYSPPAFSTPEGWRSNYDGVKNQKGTYVRLKSGASFSTIGGQNAVTLKGRVYIKGGAAPAWSSMTPGQALILGGGALLFTRTYIAQMQVSDLLESRVTEFIIPTKKTGLSIMAGMTGAAIGKSAETPGILDVAWPIVAPGIPPNPNILHNWYFRNPENQRGASGLIPYEYPGYGIDRWFFVGSYIFSGYLTIYPAFGCYIEQRMELGYQNIFGKQVTVTLLTDRGYISGSSTFPATGSVYISLTSDDLYRAELISNVNGVPTLRFHSTDGINKLYAAKLELGSVSTLHLDPPMDHAVELAKCQRFYAPVTGTFAYWQQNGNTAIFMGAVYLPVNMRANPTFTYGVCTINNVVSNMQNEIVASHCNDNRDIWRVDVNRVVSGNLGTPLTYNAFASADL